MDDCENQHTNCGFQLNDSNSNEAVEELDKLLDDIDKIEDLEEFDVIFSNLQSEVLNKSGILQNIQREYSEIKNELDSKKHFISELDNMSSEEQQKTDNLREMINYEHRKLEGLHTQQIDDLIQFEIDVAEISERFTNGPHNYGSNSLSANIMQWQHVLDTKLTELSDSHNERIASHLMTMYVEDDSTHLNLALNVLEEKTTPLDTKIKSLKLTEKQLK